MIAFKALQGVKRVMVRKVGESEPFELPREQWHEIEDVRGEYRGDHSWAGEYGEHKLYTSIFVAIEQDSQEPATYPNTHPRDANGEPILPGRYEVRRGGAAKRGEVFEDESGNLLFKADYVDRVQRVDEMTRAMSWFKESEVEATQA